jgi:KUP system potassium uptake protein
VARGWGWSRFLIGPVCLLFLLIDLSYFSANTLKFVGGGYVPIVIALFLFSVMKTWQWGRSQLASAFAAYLKVPVRRYVDLKQRMMESPDQRVPFGLRNLVQVERAIVFLTPRPILSADDPCPVNLRIYVKRNGAIPKHVILLNVTQMSVPKVLAEEYVQVIRLGANIVAVNVHYGYIQKPDLPSILLSLKKRGLIKINEKRWTIQVGEEEILVDPSLTPLRRIMIRYFQFIMRFTNSADRYFGLREFAGRNKMVVPVVIGKDFARVTVLDDEPVDPDLALNEAPAEPVPAPAG